MSPFRPPVTQSSLSDQARSSNESWKEGALRAWQGAFADAAFRRLFFLSIAVSLSSVEVLLQALRRAELREGVVLADPILNLLPVTDLSVPIFVIEYGCALTVIYLLLSHPVRLSVGLLGYGIAMYLRWVTITLVPLDPPVDIVLLIDPVVEALGGGPIFTKDLFFSGHTAAMAMFTLSAPGPRTKAVFAGLTMVIGVMLMIQRVHYAVDVFVAPAMAYAGWRLARALAGALLNMHWATDGDLNSRR